VDGRPGDINPAGTVTAFVWPYDPSDPAGGYASRLPLGLAISARQGPLAQGDLEPPAYPLYVELTAANPPASSAGTPFRGGPVLLAARARLLDARTVRVELDWYAPQAITADYTVYAHVYDGERFIKGGDGQPGDGYLPMTTWRVGEYVRDDYVVMLDEAPVWSDPRVRLGLYGAGGTRLPVLDEAGNPVDDGVTIPFAR
jgi:hypothetical protein